MNELLDGHTDGSQPKSVEKVAVCISVSSDLAFAAAVTFINFIDVHGQEGFHFRLFSDSKLPRMVKIFQELGVDFEVEVYRPPVAWTKLWGSRAIAYFSPLVLAKFEGFRLLEFFPKVIWLDYDLLITKSISQLWDRDEFDLAYTGSSQPKANGFTAPPEGIEPEQEGMSAGVLAFRRSFIGYRNATLELYRLFETHYSRLYYPEQAIFDLYLGAHPGFKHWKLDEKFGAFPGKESDANAILHAYGSKKFWNGLANETWANYYSEWQIRRGWKWNPLHSKVQKLLRGIRHLFAQLLLTLRLI